MKKIGKFRIWAFLLAFAGAQAFAGTNQSLVYQGRVVRPDGSVPNSGNLTFTISVYSPAPAHCLLYSETQIVNMTGSQGMFSLNLGTGTRIDGGAYSFSQVFVNGTSFTGLNCSFGTAFTGSSGDDRSLMVSFDDAGTVVHLSEMNIKSVPFALQAQEINGWGVNNLVKVSSLGNSTTFTTSEMANVKSVGAAACAPNEILKWNGSAWLCGADATGTSPGDAAYTGTKGIVAFDTNAATSGITVASGIAKLSNTGVSAATYGTASKVPSIAINAQGRVTSASEISISIPASQITQSGAAVGEVLKWNGSAWLPAADATGTSPGDATYAAKGLVQADTDAATSGLNLASGVISVNTGTGANQIVKLDASSKLPAVDGSALTNLNVNNIASGTLPISRGGTGASAKKDAFDALAPTTTKGDVIVFNGSNNIRLPAGSNGQVLTADSAQASGVKWAAASTGTVTSVTAGKGLTGGTITSVGTLAVDVGTGAYQIVQLDGSSKLPAVDGSALTSLSATQIGSGTLPVSRGGTGTASFVANNLVGTNGTGTALQAVTCTQNQVISFDATGNYGCYNLATLAGGVYFANGGNSFAGASTLGTNDAYTLAFKTNNTVAMTLDTAGNVGIGISAPGSRVTVKGATSDSSSSSLNVTNSAGKSLFFVRNDGKVAIGTTSPFSLFDVEGNSSGQIFHYVRNDGSGAAHSMYSSPVTGTQVVSGMAGNSTGSLGGGTAPGSAVFGGQSPNQKLHLITNNAAQLTIDSSGNVGIGTTSPQAKLNLWDGSQYLSLTGLAHGVTTEVPTTTFGRLISNNASGGLHIQGFSSGENTSLVLAGTNGTAVTSSPIVLFANKANGTGVQDLASTDLLMQIRNNSSTVLTVLGGGNVGIGTTNPGYQLELATDSAAKPGTSTWTIASDSRLKDIRAPFTRGLDAIEGIHPIYFRYKEGNPLDLPSEKEYVGIIAQDAQKVIPEAVQSDQHGYLHVTNDAIIWAILNSVKELSHRSTEELKTQRHDIVRLRDENAELKSRIKIQDKKIEVLEQRLEALEKSLGR